MTETYSKADRHINRYITHDKSPDACNFIKRETPTQVFSCKYYEIFKVTYFEKHLYTAASVLPSVVHYIEPSSLVCTANKLIGLYMIENTPN